MSNLSTNVNTLMDNGDPSNRINIVILGDGYTESELASKFRSDANILVDYLFTSGKISEPFNAYSDYFNVYSIDTVSAQSGADQTLDGITVDTAFNAGHGRNGTPERNIMIDDGLANEAVVAALGDANISADIKICIVNTSKYGGSGGEWAVFSNSSSNYDVALHEIGHSYANLADEYDELSADTPNEQYSGSELSEVNVTTDKSGEKWAHWLGYDDGTLGKIGAFEGGRYYEQGIWRPTENSKMNELDNPFHAIAQEAFVLKFYSDLDHADDYSLKGKGYKGQSEYIYSIGEETNGSKSGLDDGTYVPANTMTIYNNYTSNTLYISWLDYDGNEVSHGNLSSVNILDTYTNHVWRIKDSAGKLLAEIESSGDKYVINSDGTITQTNTTHARNFIGEKELVNPGLFVVQPLNTEKITIDWSINNENVWEFDDKNIFDVHSLNLSEGTYTVSAMMEDNTSLVRKTNSVMKDTIEWQIVIDNTQSTWTTDGTYGDDILTLGNANDTITGNGGDDLLSGGKGDDTLEGGDGDDTLIGGLGSDKFVFRDNFGYDILKDYSSSDDNITFIVNTGEQKNLVVNFTQDGEVHLSSLTNKLKIVSEYSNSEETKFVTSQDALDALKLSVGLSTSAGTKTAFDFMSADFNQDGKVSSQDALSILKYSVGLTTPEQAKWVFVDTNGDYSGVSKSNTSYTEGVSIANLSADTTVSLTGILIGDVNDSYSGLIA